MANPAVPRMVAFGKNNLVNRTAKIAPRMARMTNTVNALKRTPQWRDAGLHVPETTRSIQETDFTVNHKFEYQSECP